MQPFFPLTLAGEMEILTVILLSCEPVIPEKRATGMVIYTATETALHHETVSSGHFPTTWHCMLFSVSHILIIVSSPVSFFSENK